MPDSRSERRPAELIREAATSLAVAASMLKTSHPATSRALFRVIDRLTRQRHRLEDGEAR